nr:tyrosine-type recombinase/integrase [Vibrio lentus]
MLTNLTKSNSLKEVHSTGELLINDRIMELEAEEANPQGIDTITAAAKLSKWFKAFKLNAAPNTFRSYMAALSRYESACKHLGITWLPISASNMCKVASYLVNEKKIGVSTLRLTNTMINTIHDAAGYYKPTLNKEVQLYLKGLRRKSNRQPKQSPALEYSAVKVIVEEYLKEGSERSIRDACLVSVMFDGLLRRSEAADIRLEHILERSFRLDSSMQPDKQQLPIPMSYRVNERLDGTLYIPYSKTDQDGEGQYVYLSALSIRLISYMIDKLGINESDGNSYLFRGVETSGTITESLSDQGVYRALKRMSNVVGSKVPFMGHSCRVGGCIELGRKNIATHEIMKAGRWTSPAMPAYYTRNESVYKGAMAKYHKSNDAVILTSDSRV